LGFEVLVIEHSIWRWLRATN